MLQRTRRARTAGARVHRLTALVALHAVGGTLAAQPPGPSEPPGAAAAGGAADIAQQLQNPVASLTSVPLQGNLQFGLGPDDGTRFQLNVQPVVPFALSPRWNVISRTILPLVSQGPIAPAVGSVAGLGDVVQSVFLSPNRTQPLIWGAGPVLLLPTATDRLLGGGKWGAGPTVVALKQQGAWTAGGLANHVWSFAGSDDRADVNSTLLQPFVSFVLPSTLSFALSSESSYDWEAERWTTPVILSVSRVVTLGRQLASAGGGVAYWASGPALAPRWGLRGTFTLLYPRAPAR